jgi:Protein of unknown function (DUF3808)
VSAAEQCLAKAETLAGKAMHRARNSRKKVCDISIYSRGSAYALCQAQARLATAVVAVLNERMTEYIRGLYKIRQAYMGFKALVDHDRRRVRREKAENRVKKSGQLAPPPSAPDAENEDLTGIDRDPSATEEAGIEPHQVTISAIHSDVLDTSITSASNPLLADENVSYTVHDIKTPNLTSIPDIYTYTGSNLCFGVLLVALSVIPSAFQYILRIVGFKGDRARGLALLWETTKFANVHGAVAALLILAFYNAVGAVCDIQDEESETSFRKRREGLVRTMKSRYPQSVFWTLEEARMALTGCNVEEAIRILERPIETPVKQLTALNLIGKTFCHAMVHNYQACANGYVEFIGLSKYSHGL